MNGGNFFYTDGKTGSQYYITRSACVLAAKTFAKNYKMRVSVRERPSRIDQELRVVCEIDQFGIEHAV